jgi:signal transduction histidine kinase
VRRRLLLAMVAVAVGAVVVLGAPLAILGRITVRDEAAQKADREADAVGFAVVARLDDGGAIDAALLAPFATPGRRVEVVDREGRTVAVGEPHDADAITADVDLGGGAQVRVEVSDGEAERRELVVIGVVAGLSAVAVIAAATIAVGVARRLNRPLDALADTAHRLGDGDFTARAAMSGLAEVDAAAVTLNRGAERIEQMVTAERQFSSNASHQLRTPLTALRMRLEEIVEIGDEAVRTEAAAALDQADRLDATISELLRLAREGAAGPITATDLTAIVDAAAARWRPAASREKRTIDVHDSEPAWALASPAGAAHAIDVLLDNALRHGRGTITVELELHDATVTIDVTDEGDGIPPGEERSIFERGVSDHGSGVGLALATNLVAADGGRLTLVNPTPARFRITYRATVAPAQERAGAR